MTEKETASRLIDGFSKQTILYQDLEDLNQSFQQAIHSQTDQQAILQFLKKKKERMDKIAEIDNALKQAKEQWQANKNLWKQPELKKQVEEHLTMLSSAVSKVIESEKRIEKLLQEPAKKPGQTMIDRYKMHG